jgi:hypothetical protein
VNLVAKHTSTPIRPASKRATLIIRALHIAVENAPRVKFGIQEPVAKIPEYAAPTPEHEAIAQQSELPAVSAIPYKPVEPHDSHFWEYQAEGTRILAREAQARKAAKPKPPPGRTVWRRALSPVPRRRSQAQV